MVSLSRYACRYLLNDSFTVKGSPKTVTLLILYYNVFAVDHSVAAQRTDHSTIPCIITHTVNTMSYTWNGTLGVAASDNQEKQWQWPTDDTGRMTSTDHWRGILSWGNIGTQSCRVSWALSQGYNCQELGNTQTTVLKSLCLQPRVSARYRPTEQNLLIWCTCDGSMHNTYLHCTFGVGHERMWNYEPNTQAIMTKSERMLKPFITASKMGQ